MTEDVVPETLLQNCEPARMHGLFTRVEGNEKYENMNMNMSAAHLQQMREQEGEILQWHISLSLSLVCVCVCDLPMTND